MKNMRLVAFVVFAVCAFCLPALAQKKWTYKGDNGKGGEITIIITPRPNGYEVSGDYKPNPSNVCKLRGSYFPAGQRLRAICEYSNGQTAEVTGSKQARKDAFQVEVGFGGTEYGGVIVAKRGVAKPAPTGSSTESSSNNPEENKSSNGCVGFAGKWLTNIDNVVVILNSGGSGTYFWRGANQTISGSVSGNVLEGEYHQATHSNDNLKSGRIKFTLSADGNSFTGDWWYKDGKPGGSWNGTCQSGN